MMSEEIDNRAHNLAIVNNDSVENYFKYYQTVWTDTCDSLTAEDRAEYEQLVDDWNEYGTSEEIRKRYALLYDPTSCTKLVKIIGKQQRSLGVSLLDS